MRHYYDLSSVGQVAREAQLSRLIAHSLGLTLVEERKIVIEVFSKSCEQVGSALSTHQAWRQTLTDIPCPFSQSGLLQSQTVLNQRLQLGGRRPKHERGDCCTPHQCNYTNTQLLCPCPDWLKALDERAMVEVGCGPLLPLVRLQGLNEAGSCRQRDGRRCRCQLRRRTHRD